MQYFAIGEDNGGAGERRLGPFDDKEAAQSAGERETKDSNGAFVFRGVVDEANNQVFTAKAVTAANALRSTNRVVQNAIAANGRVARNATYNNFDKKSVEDATKRLESAAVEMSRLVPAIEQAKKIISELDPYKMEDPSTGSQDTDAKFLKALRQYIPLFKKADTLLK